MPTAIQWTDETWNPTTGCTKVSRGCFRCYIDTTIAFRMAGRKFVRGKTDLQLHPDRLDKPLHWRKPRRVFVNSLSDLFHEDIPVEYVQRVFAVMALARRHTFQVLTKRPERALELMHDLTFERDSFTWMVEHFVGDYDPDFEVTWPLPNLWLGVSIEDSRVTWRADVLREIPAAVRFISAEPLLDSLFQAPSAGDRDVDRAARRLARPASDAEGLALTEASAPRGVAPLDLSGIDWVIIGGESGPKARPFHLEHAREIIRACRLHRSDFAPAVFVKQLGRRPCEATGALMPYRRLSLEDRKGGDMDEWPSDLRIREFPVGTAVGSEVPA